MSLCLLRIVGFRRVSPVISHFLTTTLFVTGLGVASSSPSFAVSLEEAIQYAVRTNPTIREAAANRRATDHEVRQSQGALLPQVRLSAYAGREVDNRLDATGIAGTNAWKDGRQGSVVVTQTLFDGFSTINDIYRQMARAEGAAFRTQERSELVALDTVEAYLDILRYGESLAAVRQTIQALRGVSGTVQGRFSGGRAGIGDNEQAQERLRGVMAMEAEYRIRLDEARAAFRRAVGKEPSNLRFPSRLAGLPPTREAALKLTLDNNPTIRAAKSDVTASRRQYDSAAGAYLPKVSVEGRSSVGVDTNSVVGRYDQSSIRLTADLALYSGGSDAARRQAYAERIGESEMRLSGLQRSAFQQIDRAWAARAASGARINALSSQVASANGVVNAYMRDYEGGNRSLLDLLNAHNSVLSARISLAAAKTVAVYSDYQLAAATGSLLAMLKVPAPAEARAVPAAERSILPNPVVIDPGSVPERTITPYAVY